MDSLISFTSLAFALGCIAFVTFVTLQLLMCAFTVLLHFSQQLLFELCSLCYFGGCSSSW